MWTPNFICGTRDLWESGNLWNRVKLYITARASPSQALFDPRRPSPRLEFSALGRSKLLRNGSSYGQVSQPGFQLRFANAPDRERLGTRTSDNAKRRCWFYTSLRGVR